MILSALYGVRQIGHDLTWAPHVRHIDEWPQIVMTESIWFSIQITHSSFLEVSSDGLADPHLRHTVRVPKLISLHDWHGQSPGFTVTGNVRCSTCIDVSFCRLHFLHDVREAKLRFEHELQLQSPGLAVIWGVVGELSLARVLFATEHRRQMERDLKFISLQFEHFQSPGSCWLQQNWDEYLLGNIIQPERRDQKFIDREMFSLLKFMVSHSQFSWGWRWCHTEYFFSR